MQSSCVSHADSTTISAKIGSNTALDQCDPVLKDWECVFRFNDDFETRRQDEGPGVNFFVFSIGFKAFSSVRHLDPVIVRPRRPMSILRCENMYYSLKKISVGIEAITKSKDNNKAHPLLLAYFKINIYNTLAIRLAIILFLSLSLIYTFNIFDLQLVISQLSHESQHS